MRDFTQVRTHDDIKDALTGARIRKVEVAAGAPLTLHLESAGGEPFRVSFAPTGRIELRQEGGAQVVRFEPGVNISLANGG